MSNQSKYPYYYAGQFSFPSSQRRHLFELSTSEDNPVGLLEVRDSGISVPCLAIIEPDHFLVLPFYSLPIGAKTTHSRFLLPAGLSGKMLGNKSHYEGHVVLFEPARDRILPNLGKINMGIHRYSRTGN